MPDYLKHIYRHLLAQCCTIDDLINRYELHPAWYYPSVRDGIEFLKTWRAK